MSKYDERFVALGLILLTLTGSYFVFFNKERVYPKVPSKYDWEKQHMATFREIQAQVPNGYIDNKQYWEDRGYWFIKGLLTMYDNRKEEADLDNAVRLLRIMESRCQTDTDADGWKDCKSYYIYDGNDRTHGYIADAFSNAIYLIHKNKVEKYYVDATRWSTLIDQNWIPYFQKYFKAYDVDGKQMGTYLQNNFAFPFNRVAPWSTTFIWRWLDTGNSAYKEYPQRVLNRFFDDKVNVPQTLNGITYIIPKYAASDNRSGEYDYCGSMYTGANKDYMCRGVTDSGHLNYEFELLITGYEQGLISESNFNLIRNTIKIMLLDNAKVGNRLTPVLNQNAGVPRLPYADEVTTSNIFRQTGHIYNFIRFGMDDSDMVYKFEEILYQLEVSGKLNGNYYTDYFRCVKDPRTISGQTYLEFCANDGEYTVENMEIFYAIPNLGRYQ